MSSGETDPRGRRVAVVADSLLEQLLPELQQEGYGIIQLPPAGLPGEVASEWLEQVAEHVQEFAHEIVPLLASGTIRALIDRTFPAEDAIAAFDAMAGSGKFGKILLAF